MKHALTHRLPEDDLDGARGRPRLMLLLSAGRDHYAIDARQVAEIVVSVELTPLPNAPNGVAGLVNHHGRLWPVVDLCRLTLGCDCNQLLSTRIVLVQFPPAGPSAGPLASLIGLRAEHVTDGVWAEPADLTFAEGGLGDAVYLRRVSGRRTEMVSVLCLDRILPDALRLRLAPDRSQEA
jgi:chemotaxis-related protein WspB